MTNNPTRFSSSRKYPNPITVTGDTASHTLALQQIIEAQNIGNRRTKDIRASFVRVGELEELGLVRIIGDKFNATFMSSGGRLGPANGPWVFWGAGSPEGASVAPVGSMYMRTDGGAGTSLYVKESGTGSTGWVAK